MFHFMVVTIPCILSFGLVVGSSNSYPHVQLSINSTWSELCGMEVVFKTSLHNLFVSRRSFVIDSYRFQYPSLSSSCSDQSLVNERVTSLIVFISKASPDNSTVDSDETKQLSQLLSTGDSIATQEILTVTYIEEDESTRHIFSTNIVISMIVIVCIVYLIGFGLIVLTQSEGDSSKGAAEVAYIISSRNQGYKGQMTPVNKRR